MIYNNQKQPKTMSKIGRIYKAWFADQPDDLYIGSTTQTLAKRLIGHKSTAKKHAALHSIWMQHLRSRNLDLLRIQLLEEVKFNETHELRIVEDKYIQQLKPTFNARRSYVSEEEHKIRNHAYKQTPEVKAKKYEYNNRPDVKAKQSLYNKLPETKERKRARDRQPAAIAHRKEYNQRSETKARGRERFGQHKIDGTYRCEECDKNEPTLYSLKRHLKTSKHKAAVTQQAINELQHLTSQNLFA